MVTLSGSILNMLINNIYDFYLTSQPYNFLFLSSLASLNVLSYQERALSCFLYYVFYPVVGLAPYFRF